MLKKPVFFVVCAALAITNLSATIAQTGVQSHAPSLRSTWQINKYATPSTLKVQPASTAATKTFSKSSSYTKAPVSKKSVPNSTAHATLAPAPSIPLQPVVEHTPFVEHTPVVEPVSYTHLTLPTIYSV